MNKLWPDAELKLTEETNSPSWGLYFYKSIIMKTVLHRSDTRGFADHGWLRSYHTFSFANYYNPERMHFGMLRVLNDDTVAPGRGFGTHPHDNMEIISLPLEGDLEHRDSMGNTAVIREGDIQVMSAGTGITHSEYNRNSDREVKFLQIWVFPNKKGVRPRYDQISLKDIRKDNELYQVLSPFENDQGVWIHQDAWFHLGEFTRDVSSSYQLRKKAMEYMPLFWRESLKSRGSICHPGMASGSGS